MAGEERGGRWVIRPSVWFDAVCLIPLLAGMPFYTSRHEQDARWWQEQFGSVAGAEAGDGLSVLRREVADGAGKPLPAFLALWTSPAAAPGENAAEGLDGLIAAVADPQRLAGAMREISPRWNEPDDRLFLPPSADAARVSCSRESRSPLVSRPRVLSVPPGTVFRTLCATQYL